MSFENIKSLRFLNQSKPSFLKLYTKIGNFEGLLKIPQVIRKAASRIKNIVKGTYQIVKEKKYRERYREISGNDPMICRYCGHEMGLWKIWHPKYGLIFYEYENLRRGKYNPLIMFKNEVNIEKCHEKDVQLLLPVSI